jgi:hypothetical protein
MKGSRTYWRIVVAVVMIVLALVVPTTMRAAHASSDPASGVFPPDSIVFGMTYGEWSAVWWQWAFSIPVPTNPTYDTTGQNCGVKQSQPVFFLAGSATGAPVTRACTVPSTTPLFFPMTNVECSNVEAPPFFGATDAARLACAQGFIDDIGISTLKATIDGVDVKSLKHFRVASPPFDFREPAQNNIFGLPGVTSGRSESDGYWLMLMPLSSGNHTLHFEAGAGAAQNVTYNLTVMP